MPSIEAGASGSVVMRNMLRQCGLCVNAERPYSPIGRSGVPS